MESSPPGPRGPEGVSSPITLSGEALAAVAAAWKGQGKQLTARFGGSSMKPTLPPGVELSFACGSATEVGDIAVLLYRGQVVVHRVVARCGPRHLVLTRGDGTWVPDPPVHEDQVVGTVIQVRRGADWIRPPECRSSIWRRLVVRGCVLALELSEAWGRRLIAALWYCRYLVQLVPAALVRRLGGGRTASGEDQKDGHRGQPESQ